MAHEDEGRWLRRVAGPHVEARTRVFASAIAGAVVATAALPWSPWQLTLLLGWNAGAIVLLSLIWGVIGSADSAATAALSTREDETRASASLLLIGASTTSLVGVGFALVKANHVGGLLEIVLAAAAVLTVVLSWTIVNTVFTLRYAHLYFSSPEAHVDFPRTGAPDYRDFAYLAFTVGMTYQVSDTALEGQTIRRAVLRHALLSYLFGTAIVATTINILAGLVQ